MCFVHVANLRSQAYPRDARTVAWLGWVSTLGLRCGTMAMPPVVVTLASTS